MNLSQLTVSVIAAAVLVVSTEYMKDLPTPHEHITKPVRLNEKLHTTIILCTHYKDTMQVAFPNTNVEKHIPYD